MVKKWEITQLENRGWGLDHNVAEWQEVIRSAGLIGKCGQATKAESDADLELQLSLTHTHSTNSSTFLINHISCSIMNMRSSTRAPFKSNSATSMKWNLINKIQLITF